MEERGRGVASLAPSRAAAEQREKEEKFAMPKRKSKREYW